MSENNPVVWQGRNGYETHTGNVVNSGDLFVPTDSELRAFGDLMEEPPEPEAQEDADSGDDDERKGDTFEFTLEDLSHEELKAKAKDVGIADEVDLRSRGPILEALREHTND